MTDDEKAALAESWNKAFKEIISGMLARPGINKPGIVSMRIMAVIGTPTGDAVRTTVGAAISQELLMALEGIEGCSLLLGGKNREEYTETPDFNKQS